MSSLPHQKICWHFATGSPQDIDSARGGLTKCVLELGKASFDRIEVKAVSKVTNMATGRTSRDGCRVKASRECARRREESILQRTGLYQA